MSNDPLLPYLEGKFPLDVHEHENFYHLHAVAKRIAEAGALDQVIEASIALQGLMDGNLAWWRQQFGGDSAFSYLRGTALEAVVMRVASIVADASAMQDLSVVKLSTGTGVITGLSLQFRRDDIPETIPLILRRDRDDVIIGIKRNIIIKGDDGSEAVYKDELIPICVIACKMYIDATRLENVLAKARNILASHSRCHFLVAADWDALGDNEWHDAQGRLLDSLYAPVSDIVFFRGDMAKRPQNAKLAEVSLANPYVPDQLRRLAKGIELAIASWA